MKSIKIDFSHQIKGYFNFPKAIQSLEIEDEPFNNDGQFGEIYNSVTINKTLIADKLVTKIFKNFGSEAEIYSFQNSLEIQNRINNYNDACIKTSTDQTINNTTLNGLPIFIFSGELNGDKISGLLILKFDVKNYFSFNEILDNDSLYNELLDKELKYKILMAFDLVKTFHFLNNEIGFIHADFNPSNFFINLKENKIIIIDYDGGALFTAQNTKTTTFGKPLSQGAWIAPEVLEQYSSGNKSPKLDKYTDIWSVIVCINFLLLDLQEPYSFINEPSSKSIPNYLNKYNWPDFDSTDSIFRNNYEDNYDYFRSLYENLPISISKLLTKTFQEGFLNVSARPTLYQWQTVLKSALNPPKIDSFNISNLAVLSDEDFTISWRVQGTNKVILYPLNIDISNKTSYICSLKKDTTFYIEATNDVGISEKSKEIQVKVNPAPKIIFSTANHVAVKNSSLTIDWKNHYVSKILLKDSKNVLIQDLGNVSQFTFSNLTTDNVFIFEAIGKYGGLCKQNIEIKVFEEVKIISFSTTRLEYIDSENILLEFAYEKAKSAIISDSDGQVYDVYNTNTFAYSAINVSKNTKDISFELKVTGHGNDVQTQEISNVKIYAKPKFDQIKLSPGQKLLFPEKLKISFKTICVEEIIVQYGNNVLYESPNNTLEIVLTQSDTIFFTPVGKLGYKGEILKRTIQVFRPIEIDIFSNNRVTYPHIPVTLTWKVINAQKLILNPGNIDISKLSSYEVQINQDTTFSIQANNDRHQATKEIRIGILAYPKVPPEKFVRIPQNITKPMYEVIKELPINQQMFDYKKVDAFLREDNRFDYSKLTKFLNITQTTIRRDFFRKMATEFKNIYRSIKLNNKI